MPEFVDRTAELADLNRILERPGGQFVIVYGRRRVGKTTLLLHWAQTTGLPTIYWVASRNTAANLRRSLAEALWQHEHPDEPVTVQEYLPEAHSWRDLFRYQKRTGALRLPRVLFFR